MGVETEVGEVCKEMDEKDGGVGGTGRGLRRKVDWLSSDDERTGVCGLTRSPELTIPVNKEKRT